MGGWDRGEEKEDEKGCEENLPFSPTAYEAGKSRISVNHENFCSNGDVGSGAKLPYLF